MIVMLTKMAMIMITMCCNIDHTVDLMMMAGRSL